VQEVDAAELENSPAGHSVQLSADIAPVVVPNFPATQDTHEDEPWLV
jgi:hypothetical protein